MAMEWSMNSVNRLFTFLLLFVSPWLARAQVQADTSFKGSAAIAAHLLRLRALQDNFKPGDLELRLDINFELNSDTLLPSAKAQLDTLAKVLKSAGFSKTAIELAGHTCDLGDEAYNLELSRRRVQNAASYMAKVDQIDLQRISRQAYGEELPLIVGAKTEEERRVNRRVVVYLPENRAALEKMLREMPMVEGFRWGVFHYDKQGRATLVSYDGSTVLHSNDEYRIYLRPARTKYVYLYQQDSKGNARWIFPRIDIGLMNPLQPGEYYLPSRTKVFALDNTVGTESIHLVVTDSPATDLERILHLHDGKVMAEGISRTVLLRGIKEVRPGPAPIADNANVRSQTIRVSPPTGQTQAQEQRLTITGPREGDMLTIMAQHREFYMKLVFGHE